MLPLKLNRTVFFVDIGHLNMKVTVLLLLSVPLTIASPLRPEHRRPSDSFLSEWISRRLEVERPAKRQDVRVPQPVVVPYENMESLSESIGLRTRAKRAPQRGCQLGTCQLHNLADTLYQMGKTNGKDQSKRAHDPQGYGR